ncbi:MAG TPA: hypothetical protein VLD13_03165 [Gaiellaceae bacterium]|nr:hypothetical protein [Gaiellaceae bacterium]
MAKRKYQKMTPEDHARRDETQRMAQERVAYHKAKAREQEERARRGWLRRRLGFGRGL